MKRSQKKKYVWKKIKINKFVWKQFWWQIMHTIMPRNNPTVFWDSDFRLRIVYACDDSKWSNYRIHLI